jgi:hypothetical protein
LDDARNEQVDGEDSDENKPDPNGYRRAGVLAFLAFEIELPDGKLIVAMG